MSNQSNNNNQSTNAVVTAAGCPLPQEAIDFYNDYFSNYKFFKSVKDNKETFWCEIDQGSWGKSYEKINFNDNFSQWRQVKVNTIKSYGKMYVVKKEDLINKIKWQWIYDPE